MNQLKSLSRIVGYFLFAPAILLASDFAKAQSDESVAPLFSEASFAPSFGITYTSMQIDHAPNATVEMTPQTGFSGGLSIYIPSASPYVDYQTGIYFSHLQTSFSVRQDAGAVTDVTEEDMTVQRLSVPIIMKIYPFDKSNGLYFNAGVVGNYLLSAKIEGTSSTMDNATQIITETRTFNTDIKESLTPIVVDALVGIGYGLGLGGGFGFGVELNYRYGLNKLIKDTDSRADTFNVSFGIGF